MSIEVLHEWEPSERVAAALMMSPGDHVVIAFTSDNGQRMRYKRRYFNGQLSAGVRILTNVHNLYLRCADAGACETALTWMLEYLHFQSSVDEAFDKTEYWQLSWLTWWFDRFYPKTDEDGQVKYFQALEVYRLAYREMLTKPWTPQHADEHRPLVIAMFEDFKAAIRDFYLPALRAWAITYDADRPYIRT